MAGRALYGASSPRQHRTDPLHALAEDRAPNLPPYMFRFCHFSPPRQSPPLLRRLFVGSCPFPLQRWLARWHRFRRGSLWYLRRARRRAAATREAVAAATAAAASRVARGSGAAPSTQPSAGSIRPQSMADGFDSSPLHVKRGYPVGVGAVGSSHGRYGGSIGPRSPPFGLQSSWDPAW